MKSLFGNIIALTRLNHPIGIFLVLWPAWWSLAFATKDVVSWGLFFIFFLGAVLMRSAGCVINDIVDRHLDSGVERTKERPLASGALSLKAAFLVLFGLLLAAFLLLITLKSTAIILGVVVLFPIVLYPFMKRITYWPQLFLGGTINWGVLMGWAATYDELNITAILLYIACVFWTLGYDTIYAHQDMKDDLLMGIKSTAIKFQGKTRRYLFIFYGSTILFLWAAGVTVDMGIIYYVFLLLAVAQLLWQVTNLNIEDEKDCWAKFRSNQFFGGLVLLGSLLGALFRL